jgi:nucleobase:cation symporter-1, NCS1 family
VRHGFGSVLAAVSIAALVASIGMNAYSGMLTVMTTMDSLRPIRLTRSLRIAVLFALTAAWVAIALSFGGNSITYLNALLVMMLYFLMPWTAVNLIDYFWLRRGRYSIADLFRPDGLYGAWGVRGLTAYALGFAASIPFFVVPNVYTGVLAMRLDGVDIGWLVGGVISALAYLFASMRFAATDEAAAIAARVRAPS